MSETLTRRPQAWFAIRRELKWLMAGCTFLTLAYIVSWGAMFDAQVFALNTQLRALEDQETEVTGLPFGEYHDSAVSQVARATPFGGPGAAGPSV